MYTELDIIRLVKKFINCNKSAVVYFDDYEDMLSELLCQVYTKLKYYKEEKSKLSTFVYVVCKTCVLIKIRKNNLKKNKGLSISLETNMVEGEDIYLKDTISDEFDLEEEIANSDLIEKIKPLLCRETYMKYFEGKTQREIAKELNISQSYACRKIKQNIIYINNQLQIGK